MFGVNGWRAHHLIWFRLVFGAFLLVHFAMLMPWATELFSASGMAPFAESPLAMVLPSPFWITDHPLMVQATLGVGLLAALLLAVGVYPRIAAIGCWLVLGWLFAANPLIANPSLPHLGWMLIAISLLPAAPSVALLWRKGESEWRFPPMMFAAGWVVMAMAYGYSGVTKLIAPSWVDGSAMSYALSNPLARPTAIRIWLLNQEALLMMLTWGTLALELSTPLLALSRRIRPWVWLGLVLMHLGVLVCIDFAELTVGMLLVHAWTFDPAWLPMRRVTGGGRFGYREAWCCSPSLY